MAKRTLGLGKQNKNQKKQKVSDKSTPAGSPTPDVSPANQIIVEVDEDKDPEDELVQLKGLWRTYFDSDRDDELVLNGIVHECDRLLRSSNEDASLKLNDEFHALYALALSELTIFKAGEEEEESAEPKNVETVTQFFDTALERCNLGLAAFADSSLLKLVAAKILLQRIPLEYISHLKVADKNADELKLDLKLKEAKSDFCICSNHLELTFEVLQLFDDLLDIVENFGHEDDIDEGLDSDAEEELEIVKLSHKHPLYKIQKHLNDNYAWLREQFQSLFKELKKPEGQDEEVISKTPELKLYHPVARRLGQLYLKAAEHPSQIFLTLAYDNEEGQKKIDNLTEKEAQKEALSLTSKAVEYLEEARVEHDPQTWADVAEAVIDLGNLYDAGSSDQEKCYKRAEKILTKANKATHGKYEDILNNLLDGE